MAMILQTVGPARGAHWVRDGLRLYLTALLLQYVDLGRFIGVEWGVGPAIVCQPEAPRRENGKPVVPPAISNSCCRASS